MEHVAKWCENGNPDGLARLFTAMVNKIHTDAEYSRRFFTSDELKQGPVGTTPGKNETPSFKATNCAGKSF